MQSTFTTIEIFHQKYRHSGEQFKPFDHGLVRRILSQDLYLLPASKRFQNVLETCKTKVFKSQEKSFTCQDTVKTIRESLGLIMTVFLMKDILEDIQVRKIRSDFCGTVEAPYYSAFTFATCQLLTIPLAFKTFVFSMYCVYIPLVETTWSVVLQEAHRVYGHRSIGHYFLVYHHLGTKNPSS